MQENVAVSPGEWGDGVRCKTNRPVERRAAGADVERNDEERAERRGEGPFRLR